jgi:asparagine synthase (glutamine-hydrolysing)
MVERMLCTISHRGPDGTVVWADGPVGLGHAAHCTTPEADAEDWPLISAPSGTVLVADARIDNRADLLRTLDPSSNGEGIVTDAALIAAAYERWGRDCPGHLIGDFAFALWDEREHRLFCVRDAVGTRPLFYAHTEDTFAFGSEIKALFPCPTVRRTVNEDRIAEYLLGIFVDESTTFYRDVHRLRPGHALTVTPDGLKTWQYWSWDPEREIDLPSDEAYAEAFRAHFDEAVRCRLRRNQPVGSYLSGGLDSSSITVTARDQVRAQGGGPLRTYSTIYDQFPACDERPYMQAVLEQGGFEPHFFWGDDVDRLGTLGDMLDVHDEPFFAPNLATPWAEFPRIRGSGTSVLLDGHGGDEVVSRGAGRLHDLARTGEWGTLGSEIWKAADRRGGDYGVRLWGRLVDHYGLQPWVAARPWARRLYGWARGLLGNGPGGEAREKPGCLLAKSVRAQASVKASRRRFRQAQDQYARSTRGEHYLALTSPMQGRGLEILNRAATHQGIELRFPFLDRRLMAFCLALPADQKRRHGWGRYLLRTALGDRLPDTIRRRRSKTDFTTHLASGLMSERMMLNGLVFDPQAPGERYIDRTEVDRLAAILETRGPNTPGPVLFEIWRCAVFARWVQSKTADGMSNCSLM